MLDYEKNTEDLTDAELWEILEDITSNMDEDEREDWLESINRRAYK
ncbi:MAG: hypothetical protein K6B14_09470 [Lachnospiraceae bacterium]|nr:hypothetical protein [Lachnospiraceae bacterium]